MKINEKHLRKLIRESINEIGYDTLDKIASFHDYEYASRGDNHWSALYDDLKNFLHDVENSFYTFEYKGGDRNNKYWNQIINLLKKATSIAERKAKQVDDVINSAKDKFRDAHGYEQSDYNFEEHNEDKYNPETGEYDIEDDGSPEYYFYQRHFK